MKNLIITFLVLAFGFSTSSFASSYTSEVPVKGHWDDKGTLRSAITSKPRVFLAENLFIYFMLPLEDVVITIEDAAGNEVYQSTVSAPTGNYYLEIPTDGYYGEYSITISHDRGILRGVFEIE